MKKSCLTYSGVVFICPVDTVRVSITHPLLVDAHGAPIVLVGLALKLRLGVASPLGAVKLSRFI